MAKRTIVRLGKGNAMPRLTRAVPKLSKRTTNGICYAVTRIGGKLHYCGKWNTRAARAEYDRLVAEWLQAGRPAHTPEPEDVTVGQLVAEFWKHCKGYYQPAVAGHFKAVLRELRKRYGHLPVAEFGPKSLKALRASWVDAGQSRKHVNQKVARIKQAFRWAVAEELCPVEVHQRLATLPGLRKGKTDARETTPVPPVPLDVFEATLPYLPPVLQDLLRLQLYSGSRPGEIAELKPGEVDTTGDVWEYRPAEHKTAHHDKSRVIYIGPKGQDVLRPYLLRPADQHCFRPCESEKKRRRERTEQRKTPLSCGNVAGRPVKAGAMRRPGEAYTKDSINRAVRRAVEKLNEDRKAEGLEPVKRWSPNQLRHSAATLLRAQFSLEHAQVVLGHSKADVTQIYALRDAEKAREAIREIG
jgi:integrase